MGALVGLTSILLGATQIAQGFQQQQAMNMQAQMARMQGDAEYNKARMQAVNNQNKTQRLLASQVAQGAGQGIDVGGTTSSLVSIMNDTERQAQSEREMMLMQGRLAQSNNYVAAAQYKDAGSRAKNMGLISGGLTMAGGLFKAGAFSGFDNVFSGGGSMVGSGDFINKPLISQSIPSWK